MFEALNKLNSFIDKFEADHINLLFERLNKKKFLFIKTKMSGKELEEISDFMMSSSFYARHDEVVEILKNVQIFVRDWVKKQNKNLDDHGMYSHIYEDILNIKYMEAYGVEFYEKGIPVFMNCNK